jgi:hypothetical protein
MSHAQDPIFTLFHRLDYRISALEALPDNVPDSFAEACRAVTDAAARKPLELIEIALIRAIELRRHSGRLTPPPAERPDLSCGFLLANNV